MSLLFFQLGYYLKKTDYKMNDPVFTKSYCPSFLTGSISNILFVSYLHEGLIDSYRQKYELFQECILKNIFLNESQRDECIEEFHHIQKVYHAFSRLAYIWKVKHALTPIQTDLFFNLIDTNKPTVFSLFQKKTIYYFTVGDILNIIKLRLIRYEDNFELLSSENQSSKNPYNNQLMEPIHLYHLYFHMCRHHLKIPIYFEMYFQEGFDNELFLWKHDTLLRKMAIQHFTFTASDTNTYLLKNILLMIQEFHVRLQIHREFPKHELVKAFRSYVYLFLLIEYGHLHKSLSYYYDHLLCEKMEEFEEMYPRFGRKYIPILDKSNPIFHTDHLVFHSFHL